MSEEILAAEIERLRDERDAALLREERTIKQWGEALGEALNTIYRVRDLLPKHREGWPNPERTFVWADELRAALDPVAVVADPRDGDAATATACTCSWASGYPERFGHFLSCPAAVRS